MSRFMSFPEKGGFTARLWILCIICTVFWGICFDNVQADSCLAYPNAEEAAVTAGIDSSFCAETAETPALRAAERGIPAGQAYVPELSVQGGYAFIPRRTTQRTNSRSVFGSIFFLLFGGVFLSAFFDRQAALFSDGLSEIVSNTVILRYIHGQDGAKA